MTNREKPETYTVTTKGDGRTGFVEVEIVIEKDPDGGFGRPVEVKVKDQNDEKK